MKLVAKYNQLVGSTLINSDKEYISLEEEINYLKNYIDLEKERLNPNFNYEILILNINNIPIDLIEIPNMIIQPFVENALLHGLNHSDVINPKLLINFTISKDTIICEIEDNGVGIIENSKSTILSYGIATNTIYERIKLLKQIFKTNIKVDVKNKGNDVKNISGVITKVELPLKFNDI
jgi:two-component system sensor histidine kinase YesM